jgi:hypothetical protein
MAAAPVGAAGEVPPSVEGSRGEPRVDEQRVEMENSRPRNAPAEPSKGVKAQPARAQATADRAATKASAPSRAAAPRRAATSADEAPRQPPPEGDVPEVAAAPLDDDDDEVIFPVRAPSPSRPAPVLGANQSPILD